MIKAKLRREDDDVYFFGLTDENILRLQAGQPVLVALEAMQGPAGVQVAICWGPSDADLLTQLGLPVPDGLLDEQRHPRGKLRPDDQGAGAFAISVRDGTLIISFPRPMTWLGLGPDEVDGLILGLQERRAEMRKAGA